MSPSRLKIFTFIYQERANYVEIVLYQRFGLIWGNNSFMCRCEVTDGNRNQIATEHVDRSVVKGERGGRGAGGKGHLPSCPSAKDVDIVTTLDIIVFI